MKHYITPEISTAGKSIFRFQCEGLNDADLPNRMLGQKIVSFALGTEVNFSAMWTFQLIFENTNLIEFSASATQINEQWEEYSSLNILYCIDISPDIQAYETLTNRGFVNDFVIFKIEKLIWATEEVVVECGLVISDLNGREIIITAGIPPCSVTVHADFSGEYFKPLYALSECRREVL